MKHPTTFVDNMKLPIHRWYRYSAGYSAKWVQSVLSEELLKNKQHKENINVLDPFLGSATTVLACQEIGINALGFESHPLIYKIAESKLSWNVDENEFRNKADEIIKLAKEINGSSQGYPPLIYKCYSESNIISLDSLKKATNALCAVSEEKENLLCWLLFVSILRNSSHAGTAQWQYVLPNKTKVKVADAYEAYNKQLDIMLTDITEFKKNALGINSFAKIFKHDCRELNNEIEPHSIDYVITSPPYANNYDYADATRLELSFLGEISGWSDLHEYVRKYLMRSCTQHVSSYKKDTYEILKNPILKPIYDEILDVCQKLDIEKESHGGKKNYHTMIAAYFFDMAKIIKTLRVYCKEGSLMSFVIGDSAPYGMYVPVDRWIGELALSLGFKAFNFEKKRDRNTKWKNRKHTVPLKEGILWIKG